MDESVVKHLELPQVGTLKLSGAIRLGALIRPQCTGQMFRRGASCALGAAYEALFGYPEDSDQAGDITRLDCITERVPVPDFLHGNLIRQIGTEKNDNGWSRERIADWLEAQGY